MSVCSVFFLLESHCIELCVLLFPGSLGWDSLWRLDSFVSYLSKDLVQSPVRFGYRFSDVLLRRGQ